MSFIQTIRKFYIIAKDKFEVGFWFETDWGEFKKICLNNSIISVKLGKLICNRCKKQYSTIALSDNLCPDCYNLDVMYNIRKQCMFGRKDAMINSNLDCTINSPACGYKENVYYCFQSYIVYLGRFGNIIKTGISRKHRSGGFIKRLIEQGLNEAIYIDSFPSLKLAIKAERWLINTGIAERITLQDKISELQQHEKYKNKFSRSISNINLPVFDKITEYIFNKWEHSILLDIYPISQLNEKFQNSKINHVFLFPDVYYTNLKKLQSLQNLSLVNFHGDILIFEKNKQLYYIRAQEFLNKKIIEITNKGENDKWLL